MSRRVFLKAGCAGLLFACLAGICRAEVKLPAIFADNMVLQREHENPVWGWAEPGETVVVTIAGHSVTATAGKNGRWQAKLPKLSLRKEPLEMRVRGASGSTKIIRDILVGDVWLCTGPSNIFWPVKRCDRAKEEIAAATFPEIRFFTVKKHAADQPQEDCVGHWFSCRPKTVGEVSGIGYFFSRRIHREVGVPVGMFQSFWGGSRVEAWTSREALEAQPALKPILNWWEKAIREYDPKEAQATYRGQLSQWKQAVAKAKSAGKKPPRKPRKPLEPSRSQHRPACLYNGMIAPLIPYGTRGVISYQGLGNLYWAEYSRVLMPTMINDWRSRWQQKILPLGMVQPAPYPCDRWPRQNEDAYALQRESQLLLLDELANIGVAPTMDIGDLKELHFTNKQDVGRRMAQWALATVYQKPIPYAGPVYRAMKVEGNKIRIHFKNTGNGLSTDDGQAPTHFTIAGEDKVFHPAQAVIDGRTVVVHAELVKKPVAVRFAWSDTAVPNLKNSNSLPASLFRTDVPTIENLLRRK